MGVKKLKTFKRHKAIRFFDEDIRLSRLTKLGDPLEKLNEGVDFEMLRGLLEERLHEAKNKGGRRPFDYVSMFNILILQWYYNLSDVQTEFQICDRLSFMRFLGLTIADDVPDSNTVWNFRERLVDLVEELHKKLATDKKMVIEICEKGYKNRPLTEDQKKSNNEKLKTRVRLEHIFGFVENSMNGPFIC